MRAFIVIALLVIIFLVFTSNVYGDRNFSPNSNVAGQSVYQMPTQWAPLPTITLRAPVTRDNTSAPQVSGVPVTGAAPGNNTVTCVPAANGGCVNVLYYYPQTVYYPQYVAVPVGIPVTGGCPNPYTVQYGDSLSRIAQACGTSVPALLALNAYIYNPDLIFPGQVLWIYPTVVNNSPAVPVTGAVIAPTPAPVESNPIVIQPSSGQARAGESLKVRIINFPANTPVNIGVGRVGMGYQVVNQGITDANGTIETSVKLPEQFDPNEQWTVVVVTTNGPLTQAASQPFIIGH